VYVTFVVVVVADAAIIAIIIPLSRTRASWPAPVSTQQTP
jgi:hypothetical protein